MPPLTSPIMTFMSYLSIQVKLGASSTLSPPQCETREKVTHHEELVCFYGGEYVGNRYIELRSRNTSVKFYIDIHVADFPGKIEGTQCHIRGLSTALQILQVHRNRGEFYPSIYISCLRSFLS